MRELGVFPRDFSISSISLVNPSLVQKRTKDGKKERSSTISIACTP